MRLKIFLIGTLSIMILTPLVWYSLQFYWQTKTKNLYSIATSEYHLRFAYTTLSGNLDQTLYASNIKDALKLRKYYDERKQYYNNVKEKKIKREKYLSFHTGDSVFREPISIPISIKYVGVEQPVYIPENELKNSIVKGYLFNTDCWGYFEAYFPIINVHEDRPPDSLYQKFVDHVSSLPNSEGPTHGSPSPYGFYCN